MNSTRAADTRSTDPDPAYDWPPEQLVNRRGPRSQLSITVAVDSTRLGPAIGGVRMRHYPSWRDGLQDALALSRAMTYKCALAGLAHGGGKTVIALPSPDVPSAQRRAALHDVADLLVELGGDYLAGPDMGTTPEDMLDLHLRSGHALCRPEQHGGSGDSAPGTAAGVISALRAATAVVMSREDLTGLDVGLIGYGNVGRRIADTLIASGARVHVADADATLRTRTEASGASWHGVADLLDADHDVLVPAAGGGLLTAEVVARLHHRIVLGPANNQLSEPGVADQLAGRGITWVPDVVVSAGGIISAIGHEQLHLTPGELQARIAEVGRTTARVIEAAAGTNTATVAVELAHRRLLGEAA